MYLVKTPSILKPLARELLWKVETTDRDIYLTFDDGPTEGVTEKVLDRLKEYDAKATFFCLGKNVETNHALFSRIRSEGHTVGNHSFNHPDGWKTGTLTYVKNALTAGKLIDTKFFRPPYGRITPTQVAALKKKYTIVMWHVLSGDFDKTISPEKCLDNVIHNVEPGSIIVFHDSIKAAPNMHYALDHSLRILKNQGYIFRPLT
jgi:peptidoglycan-N-acetylglucosamine deacetylase